MQCSSSARAARARGQPTDGPVVSKDRIEFFNFAIEFFDQFRNFHQNFSEFSKFSAILIEFGSRIKEDQGSLVVSKKASLGETLNENAMS